MKLYNKPKAKLSMNHDSKRTPTPKQVKTQKKAQNLIMGVIKLWNTGEQESQENKKQKVEGSEKSHMTHEDIIYRK